MRLSSSPDDVLVTHGLGSCLGITVHDPAAHVGGMLHVMMPASTTNPDKARSNPWMFVDTGIPAFFSALEAAGAARRKWKVKIAGGATVSGSDYFAIGRKNYVTLKKMLWKAGVLIDAEDVGGNIARTMHMEVRSGRVWLNKSGQEWDL